MKESEWIINPLTLEMGLEGKDRVTKPDKRATGGGMRKGISVEENPNINGRYIQRGQTVAGGVCQLTGVMDGIMCG
mgnify:CR=1 FL=1